MFKKFRPRTVRRIRKVGCSFCLEKTIPSYKNFEKLRTFLSERGRIVGRDLTGVCPKHQRQLSVEIKRARHLALLPFVNRI